MKKIFSLALVVLGVMVGFLIWAIAPLAHDPIPREPTKVFAADGTALYEFSEQGSGGYVRLFDMPQALLQAVVAAEDARFWNHSGIDWWGVARAGRDNLTGGQVVSGASTIPQQLVKNLYYPSSKRTVLQKVRELIGARYWAQSHSKQETLERYLNSVYLGNNLSGVASASETYFRKSVKDLTRAESALMAGIIAAPAMADPYRHFDRARERQRLVLDQMVKRKFISPEEAEEARGTVIELFPPRSPIRAPHFVFRTLELIREQVPDADRSGYDIHTTLDADLERVVEAVIATRLERLKKNNVTNAAVVVMDPRRGEVLAYVGSADYFNDSISGQINMAAAPRAPGSALKPFLYFQAFMGGTTPATIFADLPVRFETERGESYYPRNYSYRYFGPVTARDALGSSLNISAIKLLSEVGIPEFFKTLEKFDITFPRPAEEYGLGIVLGGGEATLEDLTRAYGILASGGNEQEMVFVTDISAAGDSRAGSDRRASELLHSRHREDGFADVERSSSRDRQTPGEPASEAERASLRAEQSTYLVADILSDKTARARGFGETSLMQVGEHRIAVKTGTTEDFRDNWAFGYTPDMVVGVWVGNADRSPMAGITGVSGAVPILHDILAYRYRYERPTTFVRPSGLIEREICITSGLLANGICPKTRREIFIEGTEPREADTWYKKLALDVKGRLVTPSCGGQIREATYLIPPAEYAGWWQAADHEPLPEFDCQGKPVELVQQANLIVAPLDGEVFTLDDQVSPEVQGISFVAGGKRRNLYVWRLNGKRIESSEQGYVWRPEPGSYELALEGASGQVRFMVQ